MDDLARHCLEIIRAAATYFSPPINRSYFPFLKMRLELLKDLVC